MGAKNVKPARTLETYTSFEMFPTEYFNRQSLQQQYELKEQQMQFQQQLKLQQQQQPQFAFNYEQYPQAQLQQAQLPLALPYAASNLNQFQYPQQNFYLTMQQQHQPERSALPAQSFQLVHGRSPLVQEYGRKQANMTEFQAYVDIAKPINKNFENQMSYHNFENYLTNNNTTNNSNSYNNKNNYINNSWRKKNLGLAPSYSQQIQSVPKFSHLSSMNKF
jgi:hypothetical protein